MDRFWSNPIQAFNHIHPTIFHFIPYSVKVRIGVSLSLDPRTFLDSTTNNLLSSSNGIQTAEDNFHDTSNVTTSSSGPGDETSNPVNREESIDLTNGHHPAANHRETGRNRQDSISSNRDRQSVTTDNELATNGSHASSTTPARKTVIKSLSSSSSSTTPFSDNRKGKQPRFSNSFNSLARLYHSFDQVSQRSSTANVDIEQCGNVLRERNQIVRQTDRSGLQADSGHHHRTGSGTLPRNGQSERARSNDHSSSATTCN